MRSSSELPYLRVSAACPAGKVIRSRRRTIALVITHDAALVVRAPFHIPDGVIRDFVEKKSGWINRKLVEIAARAKLQPKEFKPGEHFLYRGESYPLLIDDNATTPLAFDGMFRLARRSLADAREAFVEWYTQETAALIRQSLDRHSAVSGITYNSFRVTTSRRRWGSCSAGKRLNFSWRLAMAPGHVLDYITAHELAHVEHMNHSRRFWDRVGTIFPQYRESERWIKNRGHLCDVQ